MKPTVAAFDFDGTISYRDTLFSFLYFCKGLKSVWFLFCSIPALFLALFSHTKRQSAKEALLSSFFKGASFEEITKLGIHFAKGPLEKKIRKEALEKIAWHKKRGDLLILVSANLEAFLIPWGKLHGFDQMIASKLAYDKQGKITGKLFGKNCRGIEKVDRLEAFLGPLNRHILYAYGDSSGDKELLEKAHFAYLAFKPLFLNKDKTH